MAEANYDCVLPEIGARQPCGIPSKKYGSLYPIQKAKGAVACENSFSLWYPRKMIFALLPASQNLNRTHLANSLTNRDKGKKMMQHMVSQSEFNAQASEFLKRIEQTGDELIITRHGKPILKVVPYLLKEAEALKSLRNSVMRYEDPTSPVGLWNG